MLSVLSPNKIQMSPVAFKVRPYPTSVRVPSASYQLRLLSAASWHSWIGSLWSVHCKWKHRCRPGQLPKYSVYCGVGAGMHWWNRIFTAAETVTTCSERQTIIFSEDCNIAVFIRLMIAKCHFIYIFTELNYFRLLLKNKKTPIAISLLEKKKISFKGAFTSLQAPTNILYPLFIIVYCCSHSA